MHRLRRIARHPVSLRHALAWLWLLGGLLLGPVQAAAHAAAMAGGFELCSASGAVAVDADGQPLPSAAASAHDCCQGGAVALPGPLPLAGPDAPPSAAPEAPARLAPPALPLRRACSRGPPAAPRSAALPAASRLPRS